jgi:hypothetical protein
MAAAGADAGAPIARIGSALRLPAGWSSAVAWRRNSALAVANSRVPTTAAVASIPRNARAVSLTHTDRTRGTTEHVAAAGMAISVSIDR